MAAPAFLCRRGVAEVWGELSAGPVGGTAAPAPAPNPTAAPGWAGAALPLPATRGFRYPHLKVWDGGQIQGLCTNPPPAMGAVTSASLSRVWKSNLAAAGLCLSLPRAAGVMGSWGTRHCPPDCSWSWILCVARSCPQAGKDAE